MTCTVNIKEADYSTLEHSASIVILGKRRTGKTTWCKYILQYLNKDIDRFVALCGNKDNVAEWKRIIQPLYVMPKNLAYLKKLRDYQDTKVAPFSENQQPIPRKYRICIIFDDCGSDRTFMRDPIINDLLSNGRHYGMTLVFLCQYLNQLHLENRNQIDYLGMLYTSNQKNIKKVHEEFANVAELRTFRFVLNACTTNRGMCWIDNTTNPTTIEEFIYYKKMIWPYTFETIGNNNIRDYGKNHYHSLDQQKNSLKKTKTHANTTFDDIDTNSDDDSDDKNNHSLLQNLPPHILSTKSVYTDKKGSIIIRKQISKLKTE
jgi:hypothetical protein